MSSVTRYSCIFSILLLALFSCQSPSKEKKKLVIPPDNTADFSSSKMDTITIPIRAVGNTMMEMKYNLDVIKVNKNSIVKIVLLNEGKDRTMHHNVVIIQKGALNKVGTQAARVGAERSYVPDIPEVIAASEMAKPGEEIEFIFTAPPPGQYVFACTYPGHYMKMKGRFIVNE